MKEATLNNLYDLKFLSELDYRFARFIGTIAGTHDEKLLLAASLVSRYRGDGHICIDLADLAGKAVALEESEPLHCPPLNVWLEALVPGPALGRPGDYRPLVLDGTRLYLYRYWDYEKRLAHTLKDLAGNPRTTFDESQLKDSFDRIFPPDGLNGDGTKSTDWRKVAALAAARSRLCVISGGPGTGKTFTVAKIMALLIEQHHHQHQDGTFHISLTAPTGKAAARLQEAIKEAKTTLHCSESVKAAIPDEASTIHRLLGSTAYSPYFRFCDHNRLQADVVVIDEASMVDMALFSKLAQALKASAQLILLGDKDQLASVEAGSVLGDICDRENMHHFSASFTDTCLSATGEAIAKADSGPIPNGMSDCIVELQKSYRFRQMSGIQAVSRAVNSGDGRQALDLIHNGNNADTAGIEWRELPRPDELQRRLEEWMTVRYARYLKAGNPQEAFEMFNQCRILCALREGPCGVYNVNLLVERILKRKGLIDKGGPWYFGRPVMIARNDYNLRLFNGDIGIAMADQGNERDVRVFFAGLEGSIRNFPPFRVPAHETVYAMTVHKSQGSEFDDVLFIMPETDSRVLTRELIYTAITRAKGNMLIWGKEDIFISAVKRTIQRSSGLRDALWGIGER
jgi:exodeoxyribonuclease V alpha subunit